MNLKRIFIYIMVMLILFQESFTRWFNITIIDYLDEILIVFLVVISLLSTVKKKKVKKSVLILTVLILLFSIIGILSCYINSQFILSRVITSNFLAIKFFLMIIAIANLNISENIKKYIISALEFWAKIVMIIGLFNFIMPNLYSRIFTFATVTYRFGFISVTSLFYHSGRFGWFMLFMALLHYSKNKVSKNEKDKKWTVIYGLLSLLSFRTKVIMSVIVIICYEIIINKRINIKKVILSLCLLLCLRIYI